MVCVLQQAEWLKAEAALKALCFLTISSISLVHGKSSVKVLNLLVTLTLLNKTNCGN